MKETEKKMIMEHNEYVFKMDVRKSELLDLFLSKEINESELKIEMDKLQEWYKQFIANILKEDKQLKLDL